MPPAMAPAAEGDLQGSAPGPRFFARGGGGWQSEAIMLCSGRSFEVSMIRDEPCCLPSFSVLAVCGGHGWRCVGLFVSVCNCLENICLACCRAVAAVRKKLTREGKIGIKGSFLLCQSIVGPQRCGIFDCGRVLLMCIGGSAQKSSNVVLFCGMGNPVRVIHPFILFRKLVRILYVRGSGETVAGRVAARGAR